MHLMRTDLDRVVAKQQLCNRASHPSYSHHRRAAIAPLYRDASSMCFEGTDHEGSAAINAKIPSLPSGQHAMTSFDSVTSISAPIGTVQTAVVALLSGQFKIEGEANPLAFAQAFVLVVDNGAPYCANDLFRFHYG